MKSKSFKSDAPGLRHGENIQTPRIVGVIRVHQTNPSLALKVAANARRLWNRTAEQLKDVIPPEELFLREARRIRMDNSGLDKLHVQATRLIDANASPASAAAKHVADRFLDFCKAQFFEEPASFAQLLSHNSGVPHIGADRRRAVWEFIGQTLRIRRDSQH